ncbi:MAG: WG repeat-containing protein [Clostridia bacterium]|nr:WG repeat-containing protein [Clostridia bacterium]
MLRILRNQTVLISDSGEVQYFDSVENLGYDVLAVEDSGKFAMMDKNGNLLPLWEQEKNGEQRVRFSIRWFDEIGNFDDYGLSKVRLDKWYGVVRQDGRVVFPFVFSELEEFKHGYAIMGAEYEESRILHGFLRYDGFMIPAEYDEVMNFSGDYAPVMVNHKWGFVDSNGKLVREPCFDRVLDNSDGMAVVEYDGRLSLYDIAANRLNN